jgi:23S rRNA (guanosine2251-2'-O)-methyltransferase
MPSENLTVRKKPRGQSSHRQQEPGPEDAGTLGTEARLIELLDQLSHPPLILILDGVQDPHNLGACLRSADAAGADAVVIPRDRAVGMTETVRTVACGAAESIPVFEVVNLARAMRGLKDRGLWLVGTADQAKQRLWDIDLQGPLGIVLGAEGKGIRRLTAKHCDFLVHIPMLGSVECLNVSVAAGVCLFEAVRQRNRK